MTKFDKWFWIVVLLFLLGLGVAIEILGWNSWKPEYEAPYPLLRTIAAVLVLGFTFKWAYEISQRRLPRPPWWVWAIITILGVAGVAACFYWRMPKAQVGAQIGVSGIILIVGTLGIFSLLAKRGQKIMLQISMGLALAGLGYYTWVYYGWVTVLVASGVLTLWVGLRRYLGMNLMPRIPKILARILPCLISAGLISFFFMMEERLFSTWAGAALLLPLLIWCYASLEWNRWTQRVFGVLTLVLLATGVLPVNPKALDEIRAEELAPVLLDLVVDAEAEPEQTPPEPEDEMPKVEKRGVVQLRKLDGNLKVDVKTEPEPEAEPEPKLEPEVPPTPPEPEWEAGIHPDLIPSGASVTFKRCPEALACTRTDDGVGQNNGCLNDEDWEATSDKLGIDDETSASHLGIYIIHADNSANYVASIIRSKCETGVAIPLE